MAPQMLEIHGADKVFDPGSPREVHALRHLDFTMEEGQFVTVIGTNGSGKSSLLNAIAGTFFLDSGSIRLDEHDVTRWPEHRRASLIGRVFQNPFAGTAPGMSIVENIALAASRGRSRGLGWALRGNLKEEIRERVRTLSMDLEDQIDQPIGTLSGGQRQALTLLMATWLKPRLLLLDEHTAALDPKAADRVIRLSEEIISRDNLTTLMVTHSMQQAAHLGNRLIMMHRGRIIRDFQGAEKKRLRVGDLLETFEEVRRLEQLDESAAEMLSRSYV